MRLEEIIAKRQFQMSVFCISEEIIRKKLNGEDIKDDLKFFTQEASTLAKAENYDCWKLMGVHNTDVKKPQNSGTRRTSLSADSK